jgi:hypothetical protein
LTSNPIEVYKVNTKTGNVEKLETKASNITQWRGGGGSGAGVSGFSATLANGTVIEGSETPDGDMKSGVVTVKNSDKSVVAHGAGLAIYGNNDGDPANDMGRGLNR